MADFSSWDRSTLEQFARESQLKLVQQEQEINDIRRDLKAAIAAYRDLIRKSASPADQ